MPVGRHECGRRRLAWWLMVWLGFREARAGSLTRFKSKSQAKVFVAFGKDCDRVKSEIHLYILLPMTFISRRRHATRNHPATISCPTTP